jgi:hypothetical protein
MDKPCLRCGGARWICAQHPDKPLDHDACDAPEGQPCPQYDLTDPPAFQTVV